MVGKIIIGTEIQTKEFDKQIEYIETRMQEISELLKQADMGYDVGDVLKLEAEYERLGNKIGDVRKQKEKLNERGKTDFSDFLKDATNSAKKFALAVIGIRTAYSILSKATSAYLATDERTTAQLQNNWTALGTILEPVIKKVVDMFRQLVTSVLYLMQQITGVNYIEKVNTKILKKQTDATKKLASANKNLIAGFDEITTLNKNDVDLGQSLDASTLFDASDISDEMKKKLDKIAEALKPIYNIIKEIVKFALDNPNVIIGIIGGAGLLSMLTSVIGHAAAGTAIGTGLAGVLGILLAIASIGIIVVEIKAIYDEVEEAKTEMEKTIEQAQEVAKQSEEVQEKLQELAKQGGITADDGISALNNALGDTIDKSLEFAEKYKKQREEMGLVRGIISVIIGEYDDLEESESTYLTTATNALRTWEELERQGQLNEEQTKLYRDALEKYIRVVEDSAYDNEEFTNKLAENKEEAIKIRETYEHFKNELKEFGEEAEFSKEEIDKLKKSIGATPQSLTIDVKANTAPFRNSINSLSNSLTGQISARYGIQMPSIKLAKGGILNTPGKGVYTGNALAGEAGKEFYMPLQDEQMLQLVGEAIGKFVTINANITNKMDSKTISRILKQIQNESDFAYNR